MRDVAALAGVSLKTVSRVINGETSVATDLADRVRQAARQLDYTPNMAASSLRRSDGRTRMIGVLLEDVANPFSAAVHRAIEDVARARGVAVLAASLDEEPVNETALALALVTRRVDGLIIAPTGTDQSYLFNDKRAGTGIVFVDRPPRLLDADAVLSTNEEGAAEATSHLLSLGHARVAFLGDLRTIATAAERHRGYVRAHRDRGVPLDPALSRHDLHTTEAAEAAANELLDLGPRPTALFTSQNLITIGAVRALRARGWQRQIALVGFDDFPLADLLEPAVTVVAQDPRRIGETAAEVLFRRMDGDRSPSQLHWVPTRLVTRGSGELPVRPEDPVLAP
jgi:LacI family transcriptional regulator